MERKDYLAEIDRVNRDGTYKADWDSLANHPIPSWYTKLKFGIFIHWGLYSVPAYDNEWYSRNMYVQGSRAFEHHQRTYGHQKDFGYKDFIPLFKAEKFDPDSWTKLFKESGAQYVMPVAEHHDGFQMYQSGLSKWNAAQMGPCRDIIGELKESCKARGLRFGVSSHRVEHWFFMGHGREFDSDVREPMELGDFYWPAQPEGDHQDLFSVPMPTDEFLEDWLLRCCELIDKYKPTILYFDWWIEHSAVKPYLKRFAAYYYNRADEWGTGCVIHYKHDAFPFGCAVADVERGQFAQAKPYPWQSDTAIARNSWCYTENNDYKTARDILWDLIDVVSKNGRMLLNVGPKSDGTIGVEDRKVLEDIGQWMQQNSEAIYDSTTWRLSQEGPTEIQEGQFADGVAKRFTSKDIRYTCKGSALYAIAMVWPDGGRVNLESLREADASKLPLFHGMIKSVQIVGHDDSVAWNRDQEALHVSAPTVTSDLPVVIKITMD